MWLLLSIPFIAAGYSLISTGAAGAKLLTSIEGYGVKKGKLLVKVQFSNPTNQEFKLTYAMLDVIAKGSQIGKIRQENVNFLIKPLISQTFQFEVQPMGVSIATLIINTLTSGAKPPSLLIKGFIMVNDIRLPYEQPIEYSQAA